MVHLGFISLMWARAQSRSARFGQGIGNDIVASGRFHEVVPPRHDDQILSAILFIEDGVGLTPGRQDVLPDRFTGFDVDGADQVIVAAAMKISPPADTAAPPLFGVPISTGSMEGMPNGPFLRAVPKGLSHTVRPLRMSTARMPP